MSAFKLLILLFLLVVNVCYSQPAGSRLTLALEDDFDTFNLTLWQHEITLAGGGNFEFQAYLNNRSTSYVRDGVLYIKPVLMSSQIGEAAVMAGYTMDLWGGAPADGCTWNQFNGCKRTSGVGGNYLNPIKSARVRTVESFTFKYGKVEVRAKLPKGDWLWPAIWMLPRSNEYGGWPSSGEIDIMESRGNPPSYPPGGYDSFGSTLHWGIDWLHNFYPLTHAERRGVDLTADFHTYGLIWNETYIGTYFDDESTPVLSHQVNQSFWSMTGLGSSWSNPWVGRGNNAPFDQEFGLIMNVACGGTTGYWAPDGTEKPWSDSDPMAINAFYNAKDRWYPTWDGDNVAMQIDSVRVWTYST